MKNFLIYIVVSTALSITSGLVYAKYYLSPRVKEMVQTKATELLGVPVQIRDLRVLILPKLSLAATGVKFTLTQPNLKVDIAKIYIIAPINRSLFSRTSTLGPIQIRVEDPRINLEILSTTKVDSKKIKDEIVTRTQFKFARDFNIDLKVDRARVKITQVSLKGEIENETTLDPLAFEVQMPGVEKDWNLSLQSQLKMTQPEFSVPVELYGDFSFRDQVLSMVQGNGSVSGIAFSLTGEQKFFEELGNWKLIVDVPDFSKLKVPPRIFQMKNLSGALHADLSAILIRGHAWQLFGDLNTKAFSADFKLNQEDLKIDGPFKFDCESKFSFAESLKVDRFILHSNLDAVEINKVGIFNKPKNIPLSIDVNLVGRDQVINIIDLTLNFLNLKAFANGSFSFAKDHPSEVNLHIDSTSLIGWEKYISIFSSGPLVGELSLDSTLRESTDKDWNIDLHPLKIEKLKGSLKYSSTDQKIQFAGPVEVDAEVRGPYDLVNGRSPLTLTGSAKLDFLNFQYLGSKGNSTAEIKTNLNDSATSVNEMGFHFSSSKASKFTFTSQIGHFHSDHIIADGVSSTLNLTEQTITGTAKVAKFGAGELTLTNLNYDLQKEKPEFSGLLDFKKMDANQIISTFDNKSSGILKGEASGLVSFTAPLFDNNDGFAHLKANGRINFKNATLANRGIDDLINEKLSQIPGVGKPKIPAVTMNGSDISVLFTLIDSNMNLLDFKLLTPAKNELLAKGVLTLPSQNLNVSGTAFLVDAPIGGDVRAANSDAQGRFVIPFALQGNLKKPEASFAQKTIQELIKKTFNFVAKRETDKLKRSLTGEPPPQPTPAAATTATTSTDPDDVEEQETPSEEPKEPAKPAENKIEALKNRLQGIFDKHE